MKLEDIDPVVMDEAIARVCSMKRGANREIKIAFRLSESRELAEWAQIMLEAKPAHSDPMVGALALIFSAVSIGLEIGYELGAAAAGPVRVAVDAGN